MNKQSVKKTSPEATIKDQLSDLEIKLQGLLELTVSYAQLNFSEKAEIDDSGSPISLLGLSLNMLGEEMQFSTYSKENVQAIINSLSEMLFVMDLEGNILSVNKKTLELLQVSKSEICKKHISEILFNDKLELQNKSKIMELLKQNTLKEVEANFNNTSGEIIPAFITGNHLSQPSGELKGFVLSAKDARDSKVLKYLQDTQTQLIQTGKLAALGEMSAGLAHELNNPLFLIRGFNTQIEKEMEKSGLLSESLRDYINEIRVNSQRMADIINHFRDFSRQAPEEHTPSPLHKILKKSHKWFKAQLDLNSIQFDWELSPEKFLISCSETQLEQVFVNLLSNAKDAVNHQYPNEGGHICIRTTRLEESVAIYFIDNGPGIDEKITDKLFDPFFTTKDVGEGTGLGLSISFGIIKNHHGSISHSSQAEKGTTFTILLPLISDE
ncbi:MAG: two-component system NtrC family sensor kinase [Chlamydiales bacterium]|jgi:two-component system NtrC family sensor kinase